MCIRDRLYTGELASIYDPNNESEYIQKYKDFNLNDEQILSQLVALRVNHYSEKIIEEGFDVNKREEYKNKLTEFGFDEEGALAQINYIEAMDYPCLLYTSRCPDLEIQQYLSEIR